MREIIDSSTVQGWYRELQDVMEECGSWKSLAEAQGRVIEEMMDNLLVLEEQLPNGTAVVISNTLKGNLIRVTLDELEYYFDTTPSDYALEILSKLELLALLAPSAAHAKFKEYVAMMDEIIATNPDQEDPQQLKKLQEDLISLRDRLLPEDY